MMVPTPRLAMSTPSPRQGDTARNPKPLPPTSRAIDSAAPRAAPARMAAQDTAEPPDTALTRAAGGTWAAVICSFCITPPTPRQSTGFRSWRPPLKQQGEQNQNGDG